jgi:glycosyltransferase involved in cell wall biosynthesis
LTDYASICLLSYNRPRLLRKTISTAIKNAHYPLELIVHDDGSDQDTLDVLREFHDNGLISLLMLNAPGQNEGQGIALNRMFGAATGDPIVKMDHDMELEPGWLAACVQLLKANHDDVEIFGRTEENPEIGCLGLFKYMHDPVDYRKMSLNDRTVDGIDWVEVEDFVGSVMVIPRAAWEEFGPFETRSPAFAEDALFKEAVFNRSAWCNALFPDDLATNVGFGLGPSTVCIPGPAGEAVVQPIKETPLLLDIPKPSGLGALRDE